MAQHRFRRLARFYLPRLLRQENVRRVHLRQGVYGWPDCCVDGACVGFLAVEQLHTLTLSVFSLLGYRRGQSRSGGRRKDTFPQIAVGYVFRTRGARPSAALIRSDTDGATRSPMFCAPLPVEQVFVTPQFFSPASSGRSVGIFALEIERNELGRINSYVPGSWRRNRQVDSCPRKGPSGE